MLRCHHRRKLMDNLVFFLRTGYRLGPSQSKAADFLMAIWG